MPYFWYYSTEMKQKDKDNFKKKHLHKLEKLNSNEPV